MSNQLASFHAAWRWYADDLRRKDNFTQYWTILPAILTCQARCIHCCNSGMVADEFIPLLTLEPTSSSFWLVLKTSWNHQPHGMNSYLLLVDSYCWASRTSVCDYIYSPYMNTHTFWKFCSYRKLWPIQMC